MKGFLALLLLSSFLCGLASAEETPAADAGGEHAASDDEHADTILKNIGEGVNKIMAEHKDAFAAHDVDKDGKLSFEEFAAMERQVDASVPDDELKEMFADEDPNGDGVISQEEWDNTFDRAVGDVADHYMDGAENKNHPHTEEEMASHRQEFDELDLNKDGKLDEEELKKGWTHDGVHDESWKEQDTNSDGILTFEEFVMPGPQDEELGKMWNEMDEDDEVDINDLEVNHHTYEDAEDHEGGDEEHDVADLVDDNAADHEEVAAA